MDYVFYASPRESDGWTRHLFRDRRLGIVMRWPIAKMKTSLLSKIKFVMNIISSPASKTGISKNWRRRLHEGATCFDVLLIRNLYSHGCQESLIKNPFQSAMSKRRTDKKFNTAHLKNGIVPTLLALPQLRLF